MTQTLLSAQHITRRFGGLTAIDNVSLELKRGAVHAVIGTNGAGKSTLVSVLSGELAPNEGTIHMNQQNITDWPQPRRARAGLGRSYQRTTIFPSLTVHENCRLTAQANHQHFWSWTPTSRCLKSNEAADRALELAGLSGFGDQIAGLLSHGGKRQLEIAMSLSTHPSVLLLDEPLAGMGSEETDRMLNLLASLKSEHAILLVEHDMDAVFRISDEITVMVNGAVIAHGDPASIKANPLVQTAYLGDDE
ncbi:ABC transporter ATP-binding protein [Pusillimonas noertemannii]|uniref:Amino acid/amide ABC transporter ATP-binding protein 1 (HAAT family) n=1 Tax=Pusillimonas noertemannii TaxID=305977 RepID=A0A2U1CRB6_9BURK|nr:ABC transporter ATP-binding protein [Pusillimonas noertemannii]NYT67755.1 ABC transporter ATP-binding protein [Pusillimonas noertemannii]PVY68426.1 amino acid/amide ABC transporter ATP-binding protein 1 (HAAT family) [Pusillimonas noertemannii]TFL12093.1 ABC transporter ATP-binding protein [Pusillimonas noertemannii]